MRSAHASSFASISAGFCRGRAEALAAADADSLSAPAFLLAGRHTNRRRRLGVSPGPVALNGPVIVTDSTAGRAPRFRPGGRSAASDSASLRSRKATPTLRGPAGTAKRKTLWFGGGASSAAGALDLLERLVKAFRSPS